MMKVLITYGSRFGSTKEIAEYMVNVISKKGIEVDLYDVAKAPSDINKYDVILIGSGIQIGRWKNTALNFLKEHKEVLRKKTTGLFVSCVFGMYPDKREESKRKFLVDIAKKYELEPAGLGLFGSCLDFTGKKGLKYNITVNIMKKDLAEMGIEYDETYEFRDWENIKEWTEELVNSQTQV
jgi:menaquinone-dependent protoporphyrinogen oxidase